ncbi:MAG: aspartate carbamoyltransferase [Sphaerochaetaceae bacterium]
MPNTFKGRSLCEIDDLSIQQRKYLFGQVARLKDALARGDSQTVDSFRINDPDYGIYEVFIEDSTRTKESFRNAIEFHHAKLVEMKADSSSFNKGESYADTFNTLTGYSNRIFIIRSQVEGVCRWLETECSAFAKRNGLCSPIFINAGDGKHEHPTQELLDEYTFIEDNDHSTASIHLAMIGDLFHGRTVHSKADGLMIFDRVKVDLIAPPELSMPDSYVRLMKANGYEIRTFDSIEAYLEQDDIADKWYFTRPQLERMGERILQKADELRQCITFRKEFLDRLKPGTKFYHPLPRHKEHPTIPVWLDDTPLNGWEKQSINGMYTRIVLLALLAGKIGDDYSGPGPASSCLDEQYIFPAPVSSSKPKTVSEGVNPISSGLVIDHILKGEDPAAIRAHMRLICRVMKLDDLKGGEWVSTSSDGLYKGLIFRTGEIAFSPKELKRLAAVSPGCTLNFISDSAVKEKFRVKMPPRIYNFDDLECKNTACISSSASSENAPALFIRTENGDYRCAYCGKIHTFKEIWR